MVERQPKKIAGVHDGSPTGIGSLWWKVQVDEVSKMWYYNAKETGSDGTYYWRSKLCRQILQSDSCDTNTSMTASIHNNSSSSSSSRRPSSHQRDCVNTLRVARVTLITSNASDDNSGAILWQKQQQQQQHSDLMALIPAVQSARNAIAAWIK